MFRRGDFCVKYHGGFVTCYGGKKGFARWLTINGYSFLASFKFYDAPVFHLKFRVACFHLDRGSDWIKKRIKGLRIDPQTSSCLRSKHFREGLGREFPGTSLTKEFRGVGKRVRGLLECCKRKSGRFARILERNRGAFSRDE